ncbi:MAG: hypothetical protein QOD39_318 [Mycobacterium sp.]|nr:hypothetical protein [Mycobacterium sp.]
MGSRVRIAAATCLLSSGLFLGGVGGALAFAAPDQNDTNLDTGDQSKPRDQKPNDDPKPGGEKPDNDPKPGDGEQDDGENGDDGSTAPTDTNPTRTTDVPPPPTKDPDPDDCDRKGDDGCGSGLPWWPFPWPWDPGPGLPPPGGPDGGDRAVELPHGLPRLPPMQLPAEHLPLTEPDEPAEPFGAVPGASVGELPLAPIRMPVVVAPPAAFGGGVPAAPKGEPLPGPARGSGAEPVAGRQSPPADLGSNVTIPPASYRVGYNDYLRTAGVSQVFALAGPGVAGMLILTGAGGLVGYRQAKAGHAVRAGGTARFVN